MDDINNIKINDNPKEDSEINNQKNDENKDLKNIDNQIIIGNNQNKDYKANMNERDINNGNKEEIPIDKGVLENKEKVEKTNFNTLIFLTYKFYFIFIKIFIVFKFFFKHL